MSGSMLERGRLGFDSPRGQISFAGWLISTTVVRFVQTGISERGNFGCRIPCNPGYMTEGHTKNLQQVAGMMFAQPVSYDSDHYEISNAL